MSLLLKDLVLMGSLLCISGVYPVPQDGGTDAWAPSAAPLSSNEPIGAGRLWV